MTGNSDPIVASCIFTNCGRSVGGGGNTALFNSVVHVGEATQWALPSGDDVFIEGCAVHIGPAANASATLFTPGKLPDARDPRSGGSSMMLMGNTIAMPGGGLGVAGPLGPFVGVHSAPAAQWRLINNRFNDPGLASWNKAAIVLVGVGVNSSETIVLADSPSSDAPASQLLYVGGL